MRKKCVQPSCKVYIKMSYHSTIMQVKSKYTCSSRNKWINTEKKKVSVSNCSQHRCCVSSLHWHRQSLNKVGIGAFVTGSLSEPIAFLYGQTHDIYHMHSIPLHTLTHTLHTHTYTAHTHTHTHTAHTHIAHTHTAHTYCTHTHTVHTVSLNWRWCVNPWCNGWRSSSEFQVAATISVSLQRATHRNLLASFQGFPTPELGTLKLRRRKEPVFFSFTWAVSKRERR